MKISAEGRSRRYYTHTLFNSNISELDVHSRPVYEGIVVTSDNDTTISFVKNAITMNGNFAFDVEFSKEDIAFLFKQAMKDCSLEEILQFLNASDQSSENDKEAA